MPENDFTDYMVTPPWGNSNPQWQGGSYSSPDINFAQLGGRHFGNIGTLGGMGMDAYTGNRGMWDVRSAGGYGNAARAQQQATMIQAMMSQAQTRQRAVMHGNMGAMGGAGFGNLSSGAQSDAMGIVSMIPGAQRVMTPGALSYQGMQQAFGAVANYGNQWTPQRSQLSGFHNAFQNYFYANGKENYARTSGLGADDMMSVVAEASRRGALKPAMFSEARKIQDDIISRGAVGGDLARAGITSDFVRKELDAARGDIGTVQQKLIERVRRAGLTNAKGEALTDTDADNAVGEYLAGLKKSAGGNIDIETLRYAGGMKKASSYGDVFKGYQNAGFGGDFSQLMDKLEQQFGDAALNPDRMRSMQQKMAAIVDMTGKSLEQVSVLMDIIQNGPGAKLSGERAAALTGIGAGVGMGVVGLTKAQRAEMQAKAFNTLGATEKSPRAVVEDILGSSTDPRMQALGKQLRGTSGDAGRDLMRSIITAPGQHGLMGAEADAFKALAAGDSRPAATMRQMQDELVDLDMTAYNQGRGSAKPEALTKLRTSLEARGVRFDKEGKAIGGPSALDRANRAGDDILGGLDSRAQDALRAAGAEFGADLTADQQLKLGGALASLSNLGSQKPAIPALQEVYKQIVGKDITAEQALALGSKAVGRVGVLGTSVNAGYYQGAVDRSSSMRLYDKTRAEAAEAQARRTGALNTLGDVMMSKDVFSSVLGGEGGIAAVLKTQGITDATMVAGLEKIGAMDDKGRQAVQMDIAGVNRLQAMLEGETDPAARKMLESDLAKKKESLASKGISESFLDKMSGTPEGSKLMGLMRDASDVEGRRKELTVKVVGVLENAKGEKIGEIKDGQNNQTSPEDKNRPKT